MSTPAEQVHERIGRSIDGHIVQLERERTELLRAQKLITDPKRPRAVAQRIERG